MTKNGNLLFHIFLRYISRVNPTSKILIQTIEADLESFQGTFYYATHFLWSCARPQNFKVIFQKNQYNSTGTICFRFYATSYRKNPNFSQNSHFSDYKCFRAKTIVYDRMVMATLTVMNWPSCCVSWGSPFPRRRLRTSQKRPTRTRMASSTTLNSTP